ncbi:MAG: hypothetical protein A2W34_08415 [Chloroflexi bacterium RBG_16_64_32]|nr:MAG: hypothetical protein A2W34_08415 [Chloroflexi bacterium RBG_16_64_32]
MDLARYQPWLLVLVLLVMGWFAAGVIWNIRRGNAILRWMQAGLPRLGEKTTLRWLGTSVVELTINRAKAPFRQVQVLLVMTPRDVPWLWLLASWRGRKDTLIVRGQLHSAPRLEYEVASPGSWTGRRAIAEARDRRWGEQVDGQHLFLAPTPSLTVSRPGALELLGSARKSFPGVWRLAVRRDTPQFEFHVPLPSPQGREAGEYFEAIRRVALGASSAASA